MAPRTSSTTSASTPLTRRDITRFLLVKLIALKNNSITSSHHHTNGGGNNHHHNSTNINANEDDPPGIDFATLGAEIYSLSKHSLLVLPSELRHEYFRLMLKYSNGRISSRGGGGGQSRNRGKGGGSKYSSSIKMEGDDSSNDTEEDIDGSSEASSSLDVGSNVGGHLGDDDGLLFPPSSSTGGGGLSPGRQSGLTWNRVQRHILICAAVPIHATGVKRSRDSSSNRSLKSGRQTLEERVKIYMSALRQRASSDSIVDDPTTAGGGSGGNSQGIKSEGDDHNSSSMAVDNDPLLKTHFFSPTIQGGSKAMSDSQRRLLLGLAIPVPVDVLTPTPLSGGDVLLKKGAGGMKGSGAKGAGGVSGSAPLGGLGRGGGGGVAGGENPNVLLAVLDQCETLQGADIFRHRVDVGTIMNHSGAQLGPYSTVVKVPMCLDIIREAIVTNTSLRQVVGAAQKGQSLKQHLKKEEGAGGGGVVKQEKGAEDDSGPQSHILPPHLFKQSNTGTLSTSASDSPAQKKQGSSPAKTLSAAATPGLVDDNFSISTLGDLRRCIWLIAANCSVFNAPEGPFPEKGRQFARRCCVVIDDRAQRLANDYLDERGL